MPVFASTSVFVLGRTAPAILTQTVQEGETLVYDASQGVFVNSKALASDGSGLINIQNTGTGDQLATVVGNTLQEKTLAAGTNITLVDDGNTITINGTSATTTGFVSLVYRTLTYSSGITDLISLPAGSIILSTEIAVLSPFDGSPTLTIGTATTPDLLVMNSEIDLTVAESYKDDVSFVLPGVGNQEIQSFFTANGATTGQFSIFLEYFIE